jgi:hypothetical protein
MNKLTVDSKIEQAIIDMLDNVALRVNTQYDGYWGDKEVGEIEYKSRDGFMSMNNGGYMISTLHYLSNVISSGKVLCDAIHNTADYEQLLAMQCFIDEQGLSDNCYSLTDSECWDIISKDGGIQESFYDYENDFCDGTYYTTTRAMYYCADNYYNETNTDCVVIDFAYNLDEYGRDNKAVNLYCRTVPLSELTVELLADIEQEILALL